MSDFYTNVKVYGNSLLFRGIKNDKRVQVKVPYKPKLYVPCKEEGKYKTLFGENLQEIKFDCIKDARNFIKQYEDVENFHVYGNTQYEYCFISELFKSDIEYDSSKIRIAIFDIEVDSNPSTGGFADSQNPFQPIISIALKYVGEDKYFLFGYHEYEPAENVYYIQCKDEYELLKKFIEIWSINYCDILSGYFSSSFDIPYLIGRMYKILGEKETKKLSPWGIIQEKVNKKFNPKFNQYEEDKSYSIIGISSLDFLELFKKHHPKGASQESYKLDSISEIFIGEKKVEYEGSLHNLYSTNKQLFYTYNIKDVYLVEKLNDKLKLFDVAMILAYDSKTNFEDVFMQTRMWDSLIFNHLKSKRIQIPQKKKIAGDFEYEGAYVKDPTVGFHKWIATIDGTSLYPSIILNQNISPDTLIEPEDYTREMREVLNQKISVDSILNKEANFSKLSDMNVAITPNGQLFRNDRKGFLPEIIEKMFNDRQVFKKKMLEYEVQYEQLLKDGSLNEELKKDLQFKIQKYSNLQWAKKICLNSAYGSVGTKTFRFFDLRLAEAITLMGQLSNRWVENGLNQYINKILKVENSVTQHSIYGDSVTSYTPIYISYFNGDDRIVDVLPIEKLAKEYGENNWISFDGKEFCELNGIEAWSDKGWTKLHRVIRHELAPDKKIIRILTHTGCVDVTDDHSLLLVDGQEISPKDVEIGTELLHYSISPIIHQSIEFNKGIKFKYKSQQSCALVYFFASKKDTDYRIRYNKKGYYLEPISKEQVTNKVIDKYEIPYSGYVYDLTTENNHFAAGIGNLIVHNTDSVVFSFEKIIEKYCSGITDNKKIHDIIHKMIVMKIQPQIDKTCKELCNYINAYTPALKYKLEKICSSGIFVAKKRYALNVFSNEGVVYAEPQIKVTGLEIVRSSTPEVVRKSLKECVRIILNENESSLQNYVKEFKKKFYTLGIEEISFPRGVNGMSKYGDEKTIYKKGTPIHVRGCLLFNKILKDKKLDGEYELIKDGDKIKFCYLIIPNIIKENVISFPEKFPKELDLIEYIDYNMMYNKVFLEPLSSITNKIDWQIEQRYNLEDFFE